MTRPSRIRSLRCGTSSRAWSRGNRQSRSAPPLHRARRRNAKRGADVDHVSLDAEAVLCTDRSDDFVSLDDALTALAERAPRKAKVVELRFFGGLSVDEIAAVLHHPDRVDHAA